MVSGIWPPDVGGPASHAPEFAAYLLEQGDHVEVVVTADETPPPRPYPVRWVSRRMPAVVRHAAVAFEVVRAARGADVVYATSMLTRAAMAARVARTPVVVKLVADEAYERAVRRGLYDGTLDAFQDARAGAVVAFLRSVRNRALAGVDHLVCPSAYLASLAVGWGVPPVRVTVVPNPAPPLPALRDRAEIRSALGVSGPMAAFAGRLTAQKALPLAFEAVARVPGLTLLVAGDGPERVGLETSVAQRGLEGRVRFLGPLDREGVLELFRAADVSVLSSAWENFPHTVVEALAVGTPVVATATGGVAEVVRDGENGLLVAPGDADALSAALARVIGDDVLRAELAARAAPSVEHLSSARVYETLRRTLEEAARGG